MTLFEATGGDYQVERRLTFPEISGSALQFRADVRPESERTWTTKIDVSGTYAGPVDVVGVADYRLDWTVDGNLIRERGSSTLLTASGQRVRSTWESVITPRRPRLERFAKQGQVAEVRFTPFRIDGNRMAYDWEGTMRASDAAVIPSR